MKVTYITEQQAINILPKGETIHTFYNAAFGLFGADWSREEIIDKIKCSSFRELTGEQAKSMGHGLALYDETAKFQSDILFVETDEAALEELENTLKKENANDEQ